MKFLVYTAEPLNENAPLDSFSDQADKKTARVVTALGRMGLERVFENQSVSLLVDNIRFNKHANTVVADIYKDASRGRPLHRLKQDGDEITIHTVLAENEDAFEKGILGLKKTGKDMSIVIEKNFGSYFDSASIGLDITPHYSSEAIQSIQQSNSIGKTIIEFAEGYDLTAALAKPPNDRDVREDNGFGFSDPINNILSVSEVSKSHQISLDISRDEWMDNVELFEDLINSDIVSTIKIKTQKDGIVKIGEGGDRAIRESIQTVNRGKSAVEEAFKNLSQ